ncbi:hypothetical protein [Massilia sp. TN1-12]|uniref:hypothetical protein n=1 Tax=Massilia paldalensis TaxID=3377675 RepID=UPI0038515F36
MKFSLVPKALALAAAVTLASCGGGGKATFPINVTVSGVVYPNLVFTTNGQSYKVDPPAKNADGSIPQVKFVFPQEIEYGTVYNVIPNPNPAHQRCTNSPFPATGTAGQLAVIDIQYTCTIIQYPLSGAVKGLTGTGLVIANGSTGGTAPVSPVLDTANKPTGADTTFLMPVTIPFASTYGLTILSQPTGQTCKLTGGANGTGAGTIDESTEAAGGVSNFVVTCTNNT